MVGALGKHILLHTLSDLTYTIRNKFHMVAALSKPNLPDFLPYLLLTLYYQSYIPSTSYPIKLTLYNQSYIL